MLMMMLIITIYCLLFMIFIIAVKSIITGDSTYMGYYCYIRLYSQYYFILAVLPSSFISN